MPTSANPYRALLRRLITVLVMAGAMALIGYLLKRAEVNNNRRKRRLRQPPPPPAKQQCAPPTGKLVAITGANGYLGSACVEIFLLRGHNVRACVRG